MSVNKDSVKKLVLENSNDNNIPIIDGNGKTKIVEMDFEELFPKSSGVFMEIISTEK